MEWVDMISPVVIAVTSSGITAVATTRPKIIMAVARAEALLREGMGSEINNLRIETKTLRVDVDECREDRERLTRRVNELELLASQQFNTVDTIGSFIKNIPTPAWMKDVDGRMYLINREFEDVFGISRLNCQGRTDEDIWPEAVASNFRSSDNLVLRRGRGQEFEELIPARPLEPVSEENRLQKWNVWRFPVVVDNKLFGIGGIAHCPEG